ncbi:MAG: hypothetical protein LBB61_04170 [Treponema sp.]|nr:hypothetical protein [Treponema sp.]
MNIRSIIVILAAVLFFSCDQYPIFYAISQEVEPTEPRIKGNPTAIVEVGESMYVASRFGRSLHSYKSGKWTPIASPGSIMEIASDGTSLYALIGEPIRKTEVYVYESGYERAQCRLISFTGGGIIQTIRGTEDGNGTGYIFASTENGLFFYKKGDAAGFSSNSLIPNVSKENIVTGAAYNIDGTPNGTYYVAVVNKGIYTLNETSLNETSLSLDGPVSGTDRKAVIGMLAVKDTIVAVGRDGEFLHRDSNGFEVHSTSNTFSGAMGIWRDDSAYLLLVGVQGGIYSTINGYREILLTSDRSLDPNNLGLRWPGASAPTTVSNTDRYTSTLGLHVVTSLYQMQDSSLFASTMKNGLWSYRTHQGQNEEVWNAEE